nr:acetyl-coenzyme A synthetase 1 [Coccidioides posadasii RMSCC 3488]
MSETPAEPKPPVVVEAHQVDTFDVPGVFYENHPHEPHLSGMNEYNQLYQQSINDPDTFWARMARDLITFEKDFDKTHIGTLEGGDNAWFVGGRLNASFNCVDRHAMRDPNKVAIIYEADEPGHGRSITYAELLKEVSRLA